MAKNDQKKAKSQGFLRLHASKTVFFLSAFYIFTCLLAAACIGGRLMAKAETAKKLAESCRDTKNQNLPEARVHQLTRIRDQRLFSFHVFCSLMFASVLFGLPDFRLQQRQPSGICQGHSLFSVSFRFL